MWYLFTQKNETYLSTLTKVSTDRPIIISFHLFWDMLESLFGSPKIIFFRSESKLMWLLIARGQTLDVIMMISLITSLFYKHKHIHSTQKVSRLAWLIGRDKKLDSFFGLNKMFCTVFCVQTHGHVHGQVMLNKILAGTQDTTDIDFIWVHCISVKEFCCCCCS